MRHFFVASLLFCVACAKPIQQLRVADDWRRHLASAPAAEAHPAETVVVATPTFWQNAFEPTPVPVEERTITAGYRVDDAGLVIRDAVARHFARATPG